MSLILITALCSLGGSDATRKDLSPTHTLRAVDVKTEASLTNQRGIQIVTVQLKIKPYYFVWANPQPRADFQGMAIELKVKTRDPKTRVQVIYPKAIRKGDGQWVHAIYEGEVAIQAIIQRAPGDRSPVEGTLLIRATALTH